MAETKENILILVWRCVGRFHMLRCRRLLKSYFLSPGLLEIGGRVSCCEASSFLLENSHRKFFGVIQLIRAQQGPPCFASNNHVVLSPHSEFLDDDALVSGGTSQKWAVGVPGTSLSSFSPWTRSFTKVFGREGSHWFSDMRLDLRHVTGHPWKEGHHLSAPSRDPAELTIFLVITLRPIKRRLCALLVQPSFCAPAQSVVELHGS